MNESDTFKLEGGCTCGQLRYRLKRPPIIVNCCHCRWCQRETGTAFALNALIESDAVSLLSGRPARVLTPSNSGKGQTIVRCPKCFIALWSHYAGAGDELSFVRVGTLDNPDALPPDVHIFTASKQPWVILPADKPAYDLYYKRSELLSEAGLERLSQLTSQNKGMG
ncbi:MAG: GFA family protein [Lysobacterales bacterium]